MKFNKKIRFTNNDPTKEQFFKKNLKDRKVVYLLPNLLTSGCLFFGFFSIISSIRLNFESAAIFIIVAGVFDSLDGRVARLTNTTSKFGVEYDSLSDMVSFGVAPGILSYLWALQDYQRLGWLAAFLYVATTALRLAKFNTMSQSPLTDKSYFSGLPCPAAAGVIATTVLLFNHLEITRKYYDIPIIILIYTLSFLMVSNVKYFSFKKMNKINISNFILMVLIMFIFSIVALEPPISLFVIVFSYLISGPILFIVRIFRKKNQNIVTSEETIDTEETKTNA